MKKISLQRPEERSTVIAQELAAGNILAEEGDLLNESYLVFLTPTEFAEKEAKEFKFQARSFEKETPEKLVTLVFELAEVLLGKGALEESDLSQDSQATLARLRAMKESRLPK
jgi:hypothetical protein